MHECVAVVGITTLRFMHNGGLDTAWQYLAAHSSREHSAVAVHAGHTHQHG